MLFKSCLGVFLKLLFYSVFIELLGDRLPVYKYLCLWINVGYLRNFKTYPQFNRVSRTGFGVRFSLCANLLF